jgi:DnaD/phage-associated family protein
MSEQKVDYATRGKTIFRVEKNKDNPFVMIDRRPIENPCLSWRAKGVLTYLVSRPDNWIVRLGDLVKRSPEGVYAVRAALKELTKAGHITRREEREEGTGRFKQYVLEVRELPISNPPTNLPQAAEPQAGNLTLNDTDSNETDINEIEEEERNPLFSFYETKIGLLTPIMADAIEKAEKMYSPKWVADAIELAATKGARHWNYCEAVLKRWKQDGRAERPARKQTAAALAAAGDRSKYFTGEYADFVEH